MIETKVEGIDEKVDTLTKKFDEFASKADEKYAKKTKLEVLERQVDDLRMEKAKLTGIFIVVMVVIEIIMRFV